MNKKEVKEKKAKQNIQGQAPSTTFFASQVPTMTKEKKKERETRDERTVFCAVLCLYLAMQCNATLCRGEREKNINQMNAYASQSQNEKRARATDDLSLAHSRLLFFDVAASARASASGISRGGRQSRSRRRTKQAATSSGETSRLGHHGLEFLLQTDGRVLFAAVGLDQVSDFGPLVDLEALLDLMLCLKKADFLFWGLALVSWCSERCEVYQRREEHTSSNSTETKLFFMVR